MTDDSTRDAASSIPPPGASAHGEGGAASADDQPYNDLQTERQTLLVSVASDNDTDEEGRIKEIGAKIGDGWRVIQAIAVSGDEAGPGGESEDFMRYQVTVERQIDAEGVIVDADRGGAAALKDVGQVSAAFDGPLPSDEDETA